MFRPIRKTQGDVYLLGDRPSVRIALDVQWHTQMLP